MRQGPPPLKIPQGWLPVDAVVVDGRPGLKWLDMSGVDLAEPFFEQTVRRATTDGVARGELFSEFDVLPQLEKRLDSVPPTGFIFHSSRCGSTLVANACRAVADSIVISEAGAVDKLIARFITDTSPGDVKETLYSVFLRAVVHALAQRRQGAEQHLFVKFACCSFSQINRINRIWPRVPCLFLYRDPVETIVSNLNNVPSWLIDKDRRVLASITGSPKAAIDEMSIEELCARTIGSLFSSAFDLANSNVMLLNYRQLSPGVLSAILKFFDVTLSHGDVEAIERGSKIYSKEASGKRKFVSDVEAKQQEASELAREMAQRWAIEPYRRLEQKRMEANEMRE